MLLREAKAILRKNGYRIDESQNQKLLSTVLKTFKEVKMDPDKVDRYEGGDFEVIWEGPDDTLVIVEYDQNYQEENIVNVKATHGDSDMDIPGLGPWNYDLWTGIELDMTDAKDIRIFKKLLIGAKNYLNYDED